VQKPSPESGSAFILRNSSAIPVLSSWGDMQRKIFWLLLITLGVVLDVALPWTWSLALSLPLVLLCWWIVYRSGWFE
jgi:hypothetical protein